MYSYVDKTDKRDSCILNITLNMLGKQIHISFIPMQVPAQLCMFAV